MENNVIIIRFKDGLDVICSREQVDSSLIRIYDPMIFEIRGGNLMLQNWLPVDIMKENHVLIGVENILCAFSPTEEFKDYYLQTLDKMNEILQSKNSPKEEDIINLMESLNEFKNLKGTLIH
jgi:hypothetical protein